PLHAQNGLQSARQNIEPVLDPEEDEPFRLDLSGITKRETKECRSEQETARISGDIIVCGTIKEKEAYRLPEDLRPKYAERTMLQGAPRAPDFILDCADQGWPPGCVRLGAEKPPPLIIDIAALPEAPPGSDASQLGPEELPESVAEPLSPANPISSPKSAAPKADR
ncbi:MAG: hypothetical protein ABJJ48_00675, partial [Marinomonas sp.]